MKPLMLIAIGVVLALVTSATSSEPMRGAKPPMGEGQVWADHDVGWATIQAPNNWKAGESCGSGPKAPCDSCLLAHSDWKAPEGERFSLMVDLTCGIGGSTIWQLSRKGARLHVDKAPPPGRCVYGEDGEEVDCRPDFYIIAGSVKVDDHWITFVYTGKQRTEEAYARCRKLVEGVRLRLHNLPKAK